MCVLGTGAGRLAESATRGSLGRRQRGRCDCVLSSPGFWVRAGPATTDQAATHKDGKGARRYMGHTYLCNWMPRTDKQTEALVVIQGRPLWKPGMWAQNLSQVQSSGLFFSKFTMLKSVLPTASLPFHSRWSLGGIGAVSSVHDVFVSAAR